MYSYGFQSVEQHVIHMDRAHVAYLPQKPCRGEIGNVDQHTDKAHMSLPRRGCEQQHECVNHVDHEKIARGQQIVDVATISAALVDNRHRLPLDGSVHLAVDHVDLAAEFVDFFLKT